MISRSYFKGKYRPDLASGCWIWAGARSGKYGKIARKVGGRISYIRAHRASWESWRGPICAGLHVLHRCDTPLCINPDHLFLGTQADNNRDMFRKGRAYDRRGCRNPRAKLTQDQIIAIRQSTEGQNEIARRYGISQSSVSRIRRKEAYADVREYELG